MFTVTTQVSTMARPQVRALVRNHPAWRAWADARGIVSNRARNAELLEFALLHPTLAASIEAVLSASPVSEYDDVEGDSTPAAETPASGLPDAMDAPASEDAAPGVFTLDDVLAPIAPLLGPLALGEISKSLTPVIDAANKPAQIVEVAPGTASRVVRRLARRGKKVTFRSLFPSSAKDAWRDQLVTLWDNANALPSMPQYIPNHQQIATFMGSIEDSVNCWATGPGASGKSSVFEFIAAVTGRPFVKIGMHKQTDTAGLLGGYVMESGGNMVWRDGVLIAAMRQPGTIICIDEITRAPVGVQGIFMSMADEHRSYTLETGEVVKAADGVIFVATDNTAGSGDEGGLYTGTHVSDAALVSRFPTMVTMDFLPAHIEAKALVNHTRCPLPAAQKLADLVALVRRTPAMAGVLVSLRQMIAFMRHAQKGFDAKHCFEVTMLSRMPATERATMEGMIDLTWSTDFPALMQGKNPAPAPITPSDSAASQAFAKTNDQF